MPTYSVAEIRAMMDRPTDIRNISVIAHVDHGKSTLTDSLVCAAGIISQESAGEKRWTDGRIDEIARGITITGSAVSLCYDHPTQEDSSRKCLINLIDTPGHQEFGSQVTAALRVTDGAVVVIDCVEGVCVQTETVLRQALSERIRPVVMINKVDRAIFELQLEPEALYQQVCRHLETFNVIAHTYSDDQLGEVRADPSSGNVCFGSGLQGWAFTLDRFAEMYSTRFGVSKELLMKRLWGDHFYDPATKKWSNNSSSAGNGCPRGFCQLVLEPIYRLIRAAKNEDRVTLDRLLPPLGIALTNEERAEGGKTLVRLVMRKFLPASEALLRMIVTHLPSPVEAQRYRVENLYSGDLGDECASAVRRCDPQGPLMIYVSKMIPSGGNRFYAFGRVFSGTARAGCKVRIISAGEESRQKAIQRVVVMMGKQAETVDDVPCGNTVALMGVDQFILKSGTITTSDQAAPFRDMKFSVAPVVRVAVKPQNVAEIARLVEGMKKLSKSDPCVLCQMDENTGECIVSGAGQLHLEVCLKDLEEEYAKIKLVLSKPVVSFKETVTAVGPHETLAKSANHHNRLYMRAAPLSEELLEDIERKHIRVDNHGAEATKERARSLVERHGWDISESRKIWCFGPAPDHSNVLVDCTKGVQYVHEIQDSMKGAFAWATAQGPLGAESMRGVRFNLLDATLHADAIHRGGGQLLPAGRRVMHAATLDAQPRLMEPIYLLETVCPQTAVSGIYSTLNRRRGQVISEEPRIGTPLCVVRAHLPVLESFDFHDLLRAQTSGQAVAQTSFSHWAILPGDPYDPTSKAFAVLGEVRKRKGLSTELPTWESMCDKL